VWLLSGHLHGFLDGQWEVVGCDLGGGALTGSGVRRVGRPGGPVGLGETGGAFIHGECREVVGDVPEFRGSFLLGRCAVQFLCRGEGIVAGR
jgi:hypothetical protein